MVDANTFVYIREILTAFQEILSPVVLVLMPQSIPAGYFSPGQPPGINSKNLPGGRD